MGGIGSGRRWQGGKDTTRDYLSLDVRRLQREGLLTPGQACRWDRTCDGETVASILVRVEADCVILKYQHGSRGGWQPMECPVWLDWTPCTYGGRRAWFICPERGCGRRVAILYGGATFACRHCYGLAYRCQSETVDDRAARRADRIRARLGWEPGILNGNGWKPKGMRWRTFERLTAEHDAFVGASLAGMAHRLASSRRNWKASATGESVSQNRGVAA